MGTIKKKQLRLVKTHDFCASRKPCLTVVMIHGLASDSSTFDNTLDFLEGSDALKNVRFVTFDLLGSGKSEKSDDLQYNYEEQLMALHNSITDLKIDTPLVLIGHSMGTFIVTRYAYKYKNSVSRLILISPPVYTEQDLDNPAMAEAIDAFKNAVGIKDKNIINEKSFVNSLKKIVLNRQNYSILSGIKTFTTLIYGEMDQFIAAFNIPKLLKGSTKYLSAIKTASKHSITSDKYTKILGILEGELDAKTI